MTRTDLLRRTLCAATALLALVFATHHSLAMFSSGDEAPVDRLVANVTAHLAKKPKDAAALYVLGRIHALAYSEKTSMLYAFGFEEQKEGELPHLDEHSVGAYSQRPNAPAKPGKEKLKEHLAAAISNYRAALRYSPNTALYHLSLASIIEKAGEEIIDAAVEPELETGAMTEDKRKEDYDEAMKDGYLHSSHDPYGASAAPLLRKLMANGEKSLAAQAREALITIWREEAIQHYWLAYMLAIRVDIPNREEHALDTPVSQEAAEHYLALIRKRELSQVEARRVPQIETDLKTLKNRGYAITPIIFSETENRSIQELLSPHRVAFDINGDGRADDCAWVRPDTSILVWDPKHTGVVRSGRQLFGSVTWWIFWRDGYQALAALDDNGNGELSGEELRGLAVWCDHNSNGISDPGEVTRIEETRIAALSVFSTETVDPNRSPANRAGLRMKDGRVLPTYDWVLDLKED